MAMTASDTANEQLPLSEKVERFCDYVFGGKHHVKSVTEKASGLYFVIVPHGSLATYDGNVLTRIVIASHILCVRADVENNGMRGVRILLHNRTISGDRVGRLYERHPSGLDLVDMVHAAIRWNDE
jgi:hypothetical protein